MITNEIEYFAVTTPASEEELVRIEERLGTPLPHAYRVLMAAGQCPLLKRRIFVPNGCQKDAFGLYFLAVDNDVEGAGSWGILKIYESLVSGDRTDYLAKYLLPFGEDGGAGLICFDMRTARLNRMPIVLFRWDEDAVETQVAESYDEFLAGLIESDGDPNS
jgi:cell wall assembly regulator SMI1